MRIINDLNHNDYGRAHNMYECSIKFDSTEQMDKVMANWSLKDVFLDFPEVDEDVFGNMQITCWASTTKMHWYDGKRKFLSAVSKEAKRAKK